MVRWGWISAVVLGFILACLFLTAVGEMGEVEWAIYW